MKVGIVVGHTKNSQGAPSPSLGMQEYAFNKDLAGMIEAIPTHLEIETFFRDGVGIAGAYQATDQFGAEATIELHFNSSHNPHAGGRTHKSCIASSSDFAADKDQGRRNSGSISRS